MPCDPSRSIVGVRVGGVIAEEEADLGLHLFHGAARLQVQLHDEVAARLERPRQPRRHQRRDLARASSRESGRRDTRPTAASGRRSRAADRPRPAARGRRVRSIRMLA